MAINPVNRPQENGRPDFNYDCDGQLFRRFPDRHDGDQQKERRRGGNQRRSGDQRRRDKSRRRGDDCDSNEDDDDRQHGDRHDDRDRRRGEQVVCPCWRFGLIPENNNLNIINNPSQVDYFSIFQFFNVGKIFQKLYFISKK